MENLTFKLYSPLTAEFLPDGSDRFWQEDELVELSGYELSDYAALRSPSRSSGRATTWNSISTARTPPTWPPM